MTRSDLIFTVILAVNMVVALISVYTKLYLDFTWDLLIGPMFIIIMLQRTSPFIDNWLTTDVGGSKNES